MEMQVAHRRTKIWSNEARLAIYKFSVKIPFKKEYTLCIAKQNEHFLEINLRNKIDNRIYAFYRKI